ncbi:MAG: hypothetical protein MUF31_13685 [Akkermansiaceae bacterium]|jgi:hypothetical protein|nr:hypothetical protein [Akkermansiaceae bacterium]
MKRTIALILALLASPLAFAEEKHDHEHHEHEEIVTQGPNGGQVIRSAAGFAFEVTVDKDRKARIVFIDKDNNPLAHAEQSITGIAGERSAPTKLNFAKGKDADAQVLISDMALPAGAHVPMILTIKTTPDGKAVTERFELHLH